MSLSLADQYFLKAVDSYPWNVEETVEALNYAISYDESHPAANCLMGRLLMEKLKRFQEAVHHFEMALIEDPNFIDTYKYYSKLLIWMGRLEKAEKIIDIGIQKIGMPKLLMLLRKASLLEAQGKVHLAIKVHKRGRLLSTTTADFNHFDAEIKRLKKKCIKAKKTKRANGSKIQQLKRGRSIAVCGYIVSGPSSEEKERLKK